MNERGSEKRWVFWGLRLVKVGERVWMKESPLMSFFFTVVVSVCLFQSSEKLEMGDERRILLSVCEAV